MSHHDKEVATVADNRAEMKSNSRLVSTDIVFQSRVRVTLPSMYSIFNGNTLLGLTPTVSNK